MRLFTHVHLVLQYLKMFHLLITSHPFFLVELGLEQGGPNSCELIRIYNNEQLFSAQLSGFGA